MKIKCECDKYFDNEKSMFNHLCIDHNWNAIENYVRLIFKIHEKIAVLENQDDGYDKMFLTEVQKLLKSLLENQK